MDVRVLGPDGARRDWHRHRCDQSCDPRLTRLTLVGRVNALGSHTRFSAREFAEPVLQDTVNHRLLDPIDSAAEPSVLCVMQRLAPSCDRTMTGAPWVL